MIYIGVDPGLTGAIAFFDDEMHVHDLPVTSHQVKATRKNRKTGVKEQIDTVRDELDGYALKRLIDEYASQDDMAACIEHVWARPTDSSVSAANFVGNAREIRGVLKSFMMPVWEVSPIAWRAGIGIKTPRPKLQPGEKRKPFDKSILTSFATQMWPTLSHLWAQKVGIDRAEACLIAFYLSKEYKNGCR